MTDSLIIKKDALRLVRRRLREKLRPLGFRPHPRFPLHLVRVREALVDEIYIWADGRHMDPIFEVSLRAAPFAGLRLNEWRLRRARGEEPITPLWWTCKISEQPPRQYYYDTDHFEAVWQYLAAALEETILPYLDGLTPEKAVSLFEKGGEQDIFLPHPINAGAPCFDGMQEQAVCGAGLWRLGRYQEGAAYLTAARELYCQWLAEDGTDDWLTERYRHTLSALDTLCTLLETQPADWTGAAQSLLDDIAARWQDYTPF